MEILNMLGLSLLFMYWWKTAAFSPAHLHLALLLGVTPCNFAQMFGVRKLGSLGYRMELFARGYI